MKIEVGKSYIIEVDHKLEEVRIEKITPAANFLVNPKVGSNYWLSFWQIYGMVVESI